MSTTKVNADVLDLTDDYAFTGTITGAGGGKVIQVVNTQTGAVATGTTVMVEDDTICQNTEGTEWMTLAITPTNSSNKLIIEVLCHSGHTAITVGIFALFQDSTSGALAVVGDVYDHTNSLYITPLRHIMTAGTTSSTTFKFRSGGNVSGTTTFNGRSSARKFGGVSASSITITEIEV